MGSKIHPVYALRVGKDGPKFTPTRRTGDATVPSGGDITVDADRCVILPPDRQGAVGRAITGGMCWTAQDVTMANLASMLAQPAGRRVVDETGLTGRYDWDSPAVDEPRALSQRRRYASGRLHRRRATG